MIASILLSLTFLAASPGETPGDDYLERYFEMFPSRATAAGRHDFDEQLEDLSAERLRQWAEYNRDTVRRLSLSGYRGDSATALDAELLRRQAEREVFVLEVLKRPWRDPLYWSSKVSNATVMLLVRDDLPAEERFRRAAARAEHLPRLAAQARAAFAETDPAEIAPELCELAAGQVSASARFYREGFAKAAPAEARELRETMSQAGSKAAPALDELAELFERLGQRATGSPRLGDHYARNFRTALGIDEPVEVVLSRALADLDAKRRETAAYGRGVWKQIFPDTEPPAWDREVVRRLFARVAEDHARDTDEFLADYEQLIEASVDFLRERDVITLPEPLDLFVGRSPSYFIGQSVGGVYPPGPFAPGAPTLLFLPTPSDQASDEQRAAFFRDFNHHFNVMITPHEIFPGHTLQLMLAARHPRKVRSLFADGVYVEGWGTFCERLLLDVGWGDPLARLAHLKKQLENIARTIVDIRVHTTEISRDEVLRFVTEEAMQDEQFAANMWIRALTSSPQLTTYYLGYRQIWDLYEDVRQARGAGFVLKEFMDGMMAEGPVPVRHYRRWLLDGAGAGQDR